MHFFLGTLKLVSKSGVLAHFVLEVLSFCMLFSSYFSSADFFQNQNFRKTLPGIPPECQTVWIQIRPNILSGLIWVQTVCKCYQQTTQVCRVIPSLSDSLDFSWSDSTIFILFSFSSSLTSLNFSSLAFIVVSCSLAISAFACRDSTWKIEQNLQIPGGSS